MLSLGRSDAPPAPGPRTRVQVDDASSSDRVFLMGTYSRQRAYRARMYRYREYRVPQGVRAWLCTLGVCARTRRWLYAAALLIAYRTCVVATVRTAKYTHLPPRTRPLARALMHRTSPLDHHHLLPVALENTGDALEAIVSVSLRV